MSKKTLLLNSSYEVLSFIPERKAFKLLFKDKVDIISTWDDNISWIAGRIKHPSIIKLKNHIKREFITTNFSRKSLIKRDKSTCQYCSKKLSPAQITIDHVVPRAHGGKTSFNNCVVCCRVCNSKKADKTPDQANMILIKKPTAPNYNSHYYISDNIEHWHSDWDTFISPNN